jgi:hypothetical protein
MKWPAPSIYTTLGLRDWSEQEEEVNGSFGSPHHGNRGARCRRAHASAAVPIERDADGADRAGHGIVKDREISITARESIKADPQ